MFFAKGKILISDILVELANDSLSENRKKPLRNSLSVKMLNITNSSAIVTHILKSENEKIAVRGNKKEDYLFGKERTLEEAISFYYENSFINEKGNLELKKHLLFTELVLMFGVFKVLYEKYAREARVETQRILKVRAQAGICIDGDSAEELDELCKSHENMAALKAHLDMICNSIRKERMDVMGLTAADSSVSLDDLEESVNLVSSYRDTMNSFPLIKKQLIAFNQYEDSYVINGLELLKSCGDNVLSLPHSVDSSEMKKKVRR